MPTQPETRERRTVGVVLTETEWRALRDLAARERRSLSSTASLLLALQIETQTQRKAA